MNLLQETKDVIKESGHTEADIVFIGSRESRHQCTWGEFCKLADREYDNGYGGQEVAEDLIIVFSDGGKLYRYEYDGAERWVYDKAFKKPDDPLPIANLFTGWHKLAETSDW